MSSEYKPIYVKIAKDSNSIFDYTNNYDVSSSLCMPRFDYGFQHWIHQNKNKKSVLEQFEGKKKVYHIMNEFEILVDDHDESIYSESMKYFNFSENMDKEDTRFYNIWEILSLCELIDTKEKNFTSLCLSDTYLPIMEYRKKNATSHGKDKYTVVGNITGKNSSNIDILKTFPKTGEFDLIIMDERVKIHPENIVEQTAQPVILKEIYNAIALQKKGGNFVCMFYETFTIPTIKMISLLTSIYDDVAIIKPLTSRLANSEIFVVCKNFTLNDKQRDNYLSKIKNILEASESLKEKTFIVDIFTEHMPDWEFKLSLIVFNSIMSNEKIKNMDHIITYIGGSNYHGDVYRVNRNKQINATKYWNDLFLASDQIKNIQELLQNGYKYSESKIKEFSKLLINSNNMKDDKNDKKDKKDNDTKDDKNDKKDKKDKNDKNDKKDNDTKDDKKDKNDKKDNDTKDDKKDKNDKNDKKKNKKSTNKNK